MSSANEPGASTHNEADFNFAVSLMQYLVVPAFVLDRKGRVLIWNRACERLTGIKAEDVLGTREHWRGFYDSPRPCLADLVVQKRIEELDALYVAHDDPSGRAFGVHAENWCVMPRLGTGLYLAIDASPIHNAQGELVAVVETLRDMSAHRRATDELQRMANHDALTGLPNRRSLDTYLGKELSRAQRETLPLSLVMIDVDHFKRYNDAYGHQKGDDCLRQVGAVLTQTLLRPCDVAARYGGEEFVLILPSTAAAGAQDVARRLQRKLAHLHLPHAASEWGEVTVSMGIAGAGCGEELSAEQLLSRADAALYQAKEAGRNTFRVYGQTPDGA